MKRILRSPRGAACLILFLIVPVTARGQRKDIIGYFPSWKWASRTNLVTPANIPYDKLTTINYAFFYPMPDGRLVGKDSIGDDLYLKEDGRVEGGQHKSGNTLCELAHRHGVKVLLSIGGWDDSSNFPEVAAHETNRKQFAHSCMKQIEIYGFDGIDIDWEYPCYIDHKGTPGDRANYTLLLQAVKDSMNVYERRTGRTLLLTAAFPAFASGAANFEMEKLVGILDRFNIMTYDFSGPWDSLSGFNAPLFAPNDLDSLRNVDAAFRLYSEAYKVPAGIINLGVPFYAHTFARCTSMYAPHGGSDTLHFSSRGCFYYDLLPMFAKLQRFWDEKGKVPYLVSRAWNVVISYDDEESVAQKAQYVLDRKAGGVIIWEITGDFLGDGTTPLLSVISSKLHGSESAR